MCILSLFRSSGCQALLPANGAPVSRQRSNRMREMFDEWVRVRTLQNWKFWIVSFFMKTSNNFYLVFNLKIDNFP